MAAAVTLEDVIRAGRDSGLSGVGVCDVEPFVSARDSLNERVASGKAGRVRFTFADPMTATDVRQTFPWAQRLVVGASSYLPAAGDPGPPQPDTGRVARFATRDHYLPLRAGLKAVGRLLRTAGHRAELLVDDNRLVDRAAAVRAGVGWWGKNSMVLAPRQGPWMLLGSVATDARLETTPAMKRDCGTCTACLPACPTGALVAPGVLDARLCLAHWAQTPGVIPRPLRAAMGDRLYGCDDCLEACPPGAGRLAAAGGRRQGRVDLVEVLEADDAALLRRFGHFYIPRREPRFLRRNALVALANGGGERAAAVEDRYLRSPDWLLRLHAAWGLARVAGPRSSGRLWEALAEETHPEVRAELELALGEL